MAVVGSAREAVDTYAGTRETAEGLRVQRRFIVETDSRDTDPVEVLAAPGLPQWGQIYQTSRSAVAGLYCAERTPERIGRGLTWRVTCSYEMAGVSGNPLPENQEIDPVFAPVEMSTDDVARVKKLDRDRTGAFIVNSAGEDFQDPVTKEQYFPTLTVEKNLPVTFDILSHKLAFVGKTNSASWFGYGADQWLCGSIAARVATKRTPSNLTFVYLATTYQLALKTDTWNETRKDQGYNYRSGPDDALTPFRNAYQQNVLGNLNGSGGQRAAGLDPLELTWYPHEQADFSGLNLPQSFLAAVTG
jgi:hypothetical protein